MMLAALVLVVLVSSGTQANNFFDQGEIPPPPPLHYKPPSNGQPHGSAVYAGSPSGNNNDNGNSNGNSNSNSNGGSLPSVPQKINLDAALKKPNPTAAFSKDVFEKIYHMTLDELKAKFGPPGSQKSQPPSVERPAFLTNSIKPPNESTVKKPTA